MTYGVTRKRFVQCFFFAPETLDAARWCDSVVVGRLFWMALESDRFREQAPPSIRSLCLQSQLTSRKFATNRPR
jgi:hypothetical protein